MGHRQRPHRRSRPEPRRVVTNPLLGQGFGTRVVSTDLGTGGHRVERRRARSRSWTTSGSGRCSRSAPSACSPCSGSSCRAVRRLAAARALGPRARRLAATALAASLISFAVGMLTFDAFAFIQVTFLAFIMLGFTAVATRDEEPADALP